MPSTVIAPTIPRAFQNSGGSNGATLGPDDLEDQLVAGSVLQEMGDSTQTLAYLVALILGKQYAPPTLQPPAVDGTLATHIDVQGTQAITQVDSAASLVNFVGKFHGDLRLVLGINLFHWAPTRIYSPDGVNVINDGVSGQWVATSYGIQNASYGYAGLDVNQYLAPNTNALGPDTSPQLPIGTSPVPFSSVHWTTPDAAFYWKDASGVVHLEGSVVNDGSGTSTAFTLPAGYRPKSPHAPVFVCYVNQSPNYYSPQISVSGDVGIGTVAATYSLDGISFLAEQ